MYNVVVAVLTHRVAPLTRNHRADNGVVAIDGDVGHQDGFVNHHTHHVRPRPYDLTAQNLSVNLANEFYELFGFLALTIGLIKLLGHVLGVNLRGVHHASDGR